MKEVSPLPKFFDLESDEYETTFHDKLFHYTKTNIMDKIKKSHQLKASSITKYKEKYKEENQYTYEQQCLVFVISFSHTKYKNTKIKKFKKCDAYITASFSTDMYSIFDYTKPVITNTGDKIMWCNKEYSNYYLDNDLKHNIEIDVKCIDPKYCTEDELTNCKSEKTKVINYKPKLRIEEKWQSETRYEFIIRTTDTNKIKKYEYLLIPIKIDNLQFTNMRDEKKN